MFEFYGRHFFEKTRKKLFNQLLLVSSYTYKGIKFLKDDKLRTGLCLSKKPILLVKKCKLNKMNFCNDIMTPLDTYPEVVINRGEFYICTPNSLRKVEANAYTHASSDRTLLRNVNERILNLNNKYRSQDHYNQR